MVVLLTFCFILLCSGIYFYLIGLLLYLRISLFILIFDFEKECVDVSFCFVFTSCLAGVELFFEEKESIESAW